MDGELSFFVGDERFWVRMDEGRDISLSFGGEENKVCAWYLGPPEISPVKAGDFIGSVEHGAPVNFKNIFFNPHAHVTHTESLGHITRAFHSVNSIVHPLFYRALLITIDPVLRDNGDRVIEKEQLVDLDWGSINKEALIIRTLPNDEQKRTRQYSHANPPYIDATCVAYLEEKGIRHLLIDLPSVDKESDNGELAFHHAFWNVPNQPEFEKTITEFIYVPDDVKDGEYLLNLQVAPIENDASPSRPVVYKIYKA